jgi:hypothetical protein
MQLPHRRRTSLQQYDFKVFMKYLYVITFVLVPSGTCHCIIRYHALLPHVTYLDIKNI